jgi:hypothetical protein
MKGSLGVFAALLLFAGIGLANSKMITVATSSVPEPVLIVLLSVALLSFTTALRRNRVNRV